ncbi:response regulator transcription factor [Chitinispirillales bacterium ANBcel5]|uniref:response regulator n=1 Tax=Cellulosispirillum alkaliphilum TaxID=3039283 RepID=UPI002A4EF55D|nr:response regulator transcription factor [Chitinispirillales bacterium ANBcel5]
MKAYIVEDHEDMRLILKRTLRKKIADIQIIGESETAEKAMEDIAALLPQIVLVDISLPGMDGIEMIRKLRPLYQECFFLVVTGHDVDQYREEAFKAGANQIVSKEDRKEMIEIIDQYRIKGN